MTVSMSSTPKKSLMLFSGRAHPELAEEIAKELDVTITPHPSVGTKGLTCSASAASSSSRSALLPCNTER